MSDYPMLISNKLHSFRNFILQRYKKRSYFGNKNPCILVHSLSNTKQSLTSADVSSVKPNGQAINSKLPLP